MPALPTTMHDASFLLWVNSSLQLLLVVIVTLTSYSKPTRDVQQGTLQPILRLIGSECGVLDPCGC
jgi:hypothetical protein